MGDQAPQPSFERLCTYVWDYAAGHTAMYDADGTLIIGVEDETVPPIEGLACGCRQFVVRCVNEESPEPWVNARCYDGEWDADWEWPAELSESWLMPVGKDVPLSGCAKQTHAAREVSGE